MNKGITFKTTLVATATAALLTGTTLASAAGTLNVSNWAEYMADATIDNLAKEYDIVARFNGGHNAVLSNWTIF